jgi:hypothetical protein
LACYAGLGRRIILLRPAPSEESDLRHGRILDATSEESDLRHGRILDATSEEFLQMAFSVTAMQEKNHKTIWGTD